MKHFEAKPETYKRKITNRIPKSAFYEMEHKEGNGHEQGIQNNSHYCPTRGCKPYPICGKSIPAQKSKIGKQENFKSASFMIKTDIVFYQQKRNKTNENHKVKRQWWPGYP